MSFLGSLTKKNLVRLKNKNEWNREKLQKKPEKAKAMNFRSDLNNKWTKYKSYLNANWKKAIIMSAR